MKHEQTPLPYAFNALEPYMDTQTMEIHYSKHHATYVSNLNKALEGYADLQEKTLEELIAGVEALPEAIKTTVKNNAGGHWNHTFFWNLLTPTSSKVPTGPIAQAINTSFGDFETFKAEFTKAALGRFGSGWAWLYVDAAKGLMIASTPNQNSPLMEGKKPILGLDVWEHAYYLKYQNRRAEYIESFWNVLNWDQVEKNLAS